MDHVHRNNALCGERMCVNQIEKGNILYFYFKMVAFTEVNLVINVVFRLFILNI